MIPLEHNGDELEADVLWARCSRAIEGDVDNGSMMAGQSAGIVRERKTAREAIGDIVREAEAVGGLSLVETAEHNAARALFRKDA